MEMCRQGKGSRLVLGLLSPVAAMLTCWCCPAATFCHIQGRSGQEKISPASFGGCVCLLCLLVCQDRLWYPLLQVLFLQFCVSSVTRFLCVLQVGKLRHRAG